MDVPSVGSVMIIGILRESIPVLVAMNVRPSAENGYEYIGQSLNVIRAVRRGGH